jgi:hypothetical protein
MRFWLHKPAILIDPLHIKEIWPTHEMLMNQKLNSISRCILLLTIIGICIMDNIPRLIMTTFITLFIIIMYQRYAERKKEIEGFEQGNTNVTAPVTFTQENHTLPTKENPYMNVMLHELPTTCETDTFIQRKPAAPSYDTSISNKIHNLVHQEDNKERNTIDQKLFSDLTKQNNDRHFTNPNTLIPNDQKAFLEFLGNPAYTKDKMMDTYKENENLFLESRKQPSILDENKTIEDVKGTYLPTTFN